MDIHVWGCIRKAMLTAVFFTPAAKGAQSYPLQTKRKKVMKRNYFRMFVVSLFALSFAVAAQGREPDRIFVNVPYDFVVSGKTLPAGAYNVTRVSDRDLRLLMISSVETGSTVLALSSQVADTSRNQPKISLQRSGDQRFLSKIETADHVFTIPVSTSAIAEAAAKADRDSYLTGTSESRKR
jgi:hypothetical protein